MYSPETLEVLNQPVEEGVVKVKRVLSDEHKAKMAEGRKRKKEKKEFLKDNIVEEEKEAVVEEVVVMEGVSDDPKGKFWSDDKVADEVDEAVEEIVEPKKKAVDDSVAPKWFKEYLTEKEKRRKKKNVRINVDPPVAKPGKLILPEARVEEKPAVVHHLMKSIFPNRYK